jgi:hypothetical protein
MALRSVGTRNWQLQVDEKTRAGVALGLILPRAGVSRSGIKEDSVASRDHRPKAHFALGDAVVSFGDLVD